MTDRDRTVESIVRDLQERAKELNCLYAIDEITSRNDASLVAILRGVIAAIPAGWQYPDHCRARITYDKSTYESSGFVETPWMQTAPIKVQGESVGKLDVVYLEPLPQADDGPFLAEEQKLINTIADHLGDCIMHRILVDSMREWKQARRELYKRTTRDWSVILDLLRHTDHSLLMRISRKMINHLCWSGIKEADILLQHFGVNNNADQQELLMESNQPRTLGAFPSSDTLIDEIFRVAAVHLSDEEIVQCIHKWMKQDRASFLVNALENHHTSLAEVTDAISRYQHAARGEVELSLSTRKGLRVSLIRRLLTEQLEYINIAKNFVDITDFHDIMKRTVFPAKGHGKIGGKGAGLFLAERIIRQANTDADLFSNVRTPKTWYITSDGLHNFVYCNHLEDVFSQKYKDIDEIRQEYPDIVQVFKHSHFSSDIIKGLSLALDDFGSKPIIVRSSSLLEDRVGAAFSGKYKSLFLANQGSKQERLNALLDAIAEVYASTFSPDPIEYRAERNLLDFQEGMGILMQEVVGQKVGRYYLPSFAGVAFSHNEFRWSPRIKREDGLVRMVPGLGTRAVDRLGDDYPILISPGQPGLRANATTEEAVRYSPQYMDVICLATNSFETIRCVDFLRECGDDLENVELLVSQLQHRHLRQPMLGQIDFEQDDLVYTFEGLLSRTPFIKQMKAIVDALCDAMQVPVDVEFASDGHDLYLLQCRAQTPGQNQTAAAIPRDVPRERIVFSANRYVSSGTVANITHIVYVDPAKYAALGSAEELAQVGRIVGKLNKILPKRQFILMGPGRWGSRGDIRLGVRVTYSQINNTAMLIEIARRTGDYTPDLSFGTHFFQDLVEASIKYLPLYPDEGGVAFNEDFLSKTPNVVTQLCPDAASVADVVRVIDVPNATHGHLLHVLMNADEDEAVALLVPPDATTAAAIVDAGSAPQVHAEQEQDWRWRMRMAEKIASTLDPERFAVAGLYVFGSTKNGTAEPGSDLDLIVHFRGNAAQRAALEHWFEGWSRCLAEMNYLRTGAAREDLLDVVYITDDDIANQTSYARKIDAVTDAARPLPLGEQHPQQDVVDALQDGLSSEVRG